MVTISMINNINVNKLKILLIFLKNKHQLVVAIERVIGQLT